jgi:hypothetical protein
MVVEHTTIMGDVAIAHIQNSGQAPREGAARR